MTVLSKLMVKRARGLNFRIAMINLRLQLKDQGQQNQQNPQSQLSSMRANIPDTRTFYLLPILFFDMGTNNLYKMFRQAAVASYELKRTLVIPYFHTQPTVRDLIEDESRNEVLGQEEADHKILRDPGQGKPCVGLF